MSNQFPIINIPDDVERRQEQMGTKFKFWCLVEGYGNSLFKVGHCNTGEDWAEKVSSELCRMLELPHANYEFATWKDMNGVISPNFMSEAEALIPGNVLLTLIDEDYPEYQKFRVQKHTIAAIFDALTSIEALNPPSRMPDGIVKAAELFTGYLMLDAWIGNTDRHHENWALVSDQTIADSIYYLAPTHDHAASLGCFLREDEVFVRLHTRDKGRSIEKYASRGLSAIYDAEDYSKPQGLVDAFKSASFLCPDAAKIWISQLKNIDMMEVKDVFDRVPDYLITDNARKFALRLLEINRERLLNLL